LSLQMRLENSELSN